VRHLAVLLAALALSTASYAQGKGQRKVTVCHSNGQTLSLPEPAVKAHLDHGDRLGACAGGTTNPGGPSGGGRHGGGSAGHGQGKGSEKQGARKK